MGNVDLPYVHLVRDRHGVEKYAYYRRDGQRLKIAGKIGTVPWLANYRRIHEGFEKGVPVKNGEGTVGWWLQQYQTSAEYKELAAKTRKGYDRYADVLRDGEVLKRDKDSGAVIDQIESLSDMAIEGLTDAVILRLRDRFAGEHGTPDYRPSAGNGLATFLRLFVAYAGGKRKKLKTGDGHRPGEESEIDQFRARHDDLTRKRIAFELALNTGQRGGDVIGMTRQHIRGDEISVVQEKTGERVWIPMSADLKAVLLPWMKDRVGFILTNESNGQITEDYFRKMMREAYDEAGLPKDFTTHGLRYTAATRIFEVLKAKGYTDDQAWEHVAAITGHATAAMARKYTEKKRKARLAVAEVDAALVAAKAEKA